MIKREIDIASLPKHTEGRYKGKVDWIHSEGYRIHFEYDSIQGYILILKYDRKNERVTIEYEGKTFEILTISLKECRLGNFLGMYNTSFDYNIGDIIENKVSKIKILEQLRIKQKCGKTCRAYKYICLNCGNIDTIIEASIREGSGCNTCCPSPQKVLVGYNDLYTTAHWIVEYLKYKEDAHKYTHSSGDKVWMKCPACGFERLVPLSRIYSQGFNCPKCGDKISIGEKMVFGLIDFLDKDFITEYNPKWNKLGKRRYDFYLEFNNEQYIIETHGKQHYEENTNFKRSLIEEQDNDKLKKQIALENGIQEESYIVIDCRESNFDFIKQNILKSKLNEVFELNKIDWNKILEFCVSTRVKEACNHWNNGIHNTIEIGEIMKIGKNAIRNWLKQGALLNWCDYNADQVMLESAKRLNESNKKPIICISDEMIFDSIKSTIEYYYKEHNLKICDSSVSMVCNNKQKKTHGLIFKYISDLTKEEYIKYDIENKLNN